MAYYINGVEYAEEDYYVQSEIIKIETEARRELVNRYVQQVLDELITMDMVPAEYYDEVYYTLYPLPHEPEATADDYQAALEEMGVSFDEEA